VCAARLPAGVLNIDGVAIKILRQIKNGSQPAQKEKASINQLNNFLVSSKY